MEDDYETLIENARFIGDRWAAFLELPPTVRDNRFIAGLHLLHAGMWSEQGYKPGMWTAMLDPNYTGQFKDPYDETTER